VCRRRAFAQRFLDSAPADDRTGKRTKDAKWKWTIYEHFRTGVFACVCMAACFFLKFIENRGVIGSGRRDLNPPHIVLARIYCS
jgi:hypothetical protein